MTTQEAAERLGWALPTVQKWARLWKLKKNGRDYLIDVGTLDKLRAKKDGRRHEGSQRKSKVN